MRRKVRRLCDSAIIESLAAGITVVAVSVGISIALWRASTHAKDNNGSTLLDG